MHGVFEENAGVFPKVFENEDDYFSYLSETAIFTATRGEVTYYFEPVSYTHLEGWQNHSSIKVNWYQTKLQMELLKNVWLNLILLKKVSC